ncbi:MAG: transglutaminase family protein [Candidatus Omnitrophica bacterium]|nr:transglutaminase family protein [Candidatus Omnitrophota bacterium]
MFLAIRHATVYSYDKPVILEPHIIRLTPRQDAYKRLVERSLTIIPEPDGMSVNFDLSGSLTHLVCFKRSTMALTILSRVTLELNEANPFDFIVYPLICLNLPMQYPAELMGRLRPFMSSEGIPPKVEEFAKETMIEAKNNVMDFCSILCERLQKQFTYEPRKTGAPYAPEQVLSYRRGSCRDLAVLYMAAARAVGLAARFVSGYYFDQSPKHPQLHAWSEVYIPGGGWRGYDPTLGLACYGHHIALAAGASPSQTAVVEGSFLGQPESQMEANIEYEYLKQFSRAVEF